MTTKNDDGLRARMATLLKTPVPVLRKRLAAAGQDPAGLSRDALVKALATTTPTAPPAAKAPVPKQAKATTATARKTGARDPRLPVPGTVLERTYKGKVHRCTVLRDGFGYEAETYGSLTAVAKKATGYPAISGPLFWGLTKPASEPEAEKATAPEPAKAPAKKRGRPISAKRKD